MEHAASMAQEQLSLELTLAFAVCVAPATPRPRFFLCVYCDRKFRNAQGLGGHQNAHRQERTMAKRRLETAAAMAHSWNAWKATAAASRTSAMAAAGGVAQKRSRRSSSERHHELDLSLRL